MTRCGASTSGVMTMKFPRSEDDLAGEVAVVTGASRGLGLLLATELARRGCRLLICARDQAELDRAAERLRATGAQVATVTCDIAQEESVALLMDRAQEEYGRLDILISNAGVIRVGPVESTSPADFEQALAIMAVAPARLALAALPLMRAQQHGRIVTITSLGGKLAVPHLMPYSMAKFAAVGFSDGLRAELGRGPVTVTTVVPGLMRTGSHVNAEFAGRRDQEFTWFSLGASLPLVSMDAERAARQIVAGVAQRRAEVFPTPAGPAPGRPGGGGAGPAQGRAARDPAAAAAGAGRRRDRRARPPAAAGPVRAGVRGPDPDGPAGLGPGQRAQGRRTTF